MAARLNTCSIILTVWRFVLLGDSAHALTPHLGQGANQAIEDAITLAVLLRACGPTDIASRLRLCEDLGIARTRQVPSGTREVGRTCRSTEMARWAQADQIARIFDAIAVNTYDAEKVAEEALTSV